MAWNDCVAIYFFLDTLDKNGQRRAVWVERFGLTWWIGLLRDSSTALRMTDLRGVGGRQRQGQRPRRNSGVPFDFAQGRLSTARRTMKLSVASVGMTVVWGWDVAWRERRFAGSKVRAVGLKPARCQCASRRLAPRQTRGNPAEDSYPGIDPLRVAEGVHGVGLRGAVGGGEAGCEGDEEEQE